MVNPDQTELPFLPLTTLNIKPGVQGTWDSQSPENATHLAKGFCLSESQATTDLVAYRGAHVSTLQPARLALGPPSTCGQGSPHMCIYGGPRRPGRFKVLLSI